MTEPLSSKDATNRIRQIVRFGEVQTTAHCRLRMRERRFDFQDLVSLLLNGEVLDQPEHDEKRDQYRYRVQGTTIDEDSAIAVTVIISFRSVLVVTIFEGADIE